MAFDANRNLLFGILALQMDFVRREQLIAATSVWLQDKSRAIEDILIEQGALSVDDGKLLAPLVQRHIESHDDDASQSLAALSSIHSVADELRGLGDLQIEATLGCLSDQPHTSPPGQSAVHEIVVGERSSAGPDSRHSFRFRIIRPHAKGGLGEISLARDTELNRSVAIKEIQQQYANDPDSQSRFLLEAEVTGGLEHPGIVPVYGLGHYEDGRPFYAMRFIKGDSLKEAADRFHAVRFGESKRQAVSLDSVEFRKLLSRFLDVCYAIEYAHSRGVLHRDLKPGNIMLGKYGETLVVDWGLAKVKGRDANTRVEGETTLRPTHSSGSAPTQMGSAIGTPAFMPPEQAAGELEELGPASDVYSLGATLYYMLVGRPPVESKDLNEVLRQVRTGNFPTPRIIDHAIPKDLEAVCLKAMALSPDARYVSPQQLAEDLERFLANEPISARREDLAERVRRWGRRHKPIVAGAASLLITAGTALGVGLVIVSRQQQLTVIERDQKEAARQQIRATLDAVASEAIDTLLAQQTQLNDQHRAFMRLTLDGYRQFAEDSSADPVTRAEVASAHLRMARIRGLLGEIAEQDQALEAATSMYEQLAREQPENADVARDLAACHVAQGTRYALARDDALAQRHFEQAREILRGLLGRDALHTKTRANLAVALNGLGNVMCDLRRNEEGLAAYQESLDLLDGLAAEFPDESRYRSLLANGRYNLGILFGDLNRSEASHQEYRKSIALYEQLTESLPFDPDMRLKLSSSLINLGNSIARDPGRLPEGIELCDRGRQLQESLIAQYPAVPLYRLRLGRTYRSLADLNEQLDRLDEGAAMHRRALEVREALMIDFAGQPEYRRDLGSGRYEFGRFLYRYDRPEKAQVEFRHALEVQDTLVAEEPEVADYSIELTRTLGMLGTLTLESDRFDEATTFFERARVLQEELAVRYPAELQLRTELGLTYALLAAVKLEQEEPVAALPWAERAVGHLETLQADHPKYRPIRSYLRTAHYNRARALVSINRPEEAVEALRNAMAAGMTDAKRLTEDPHFESLRDRSDFQQLLNESVEP